MADELDGTELILHDHTRVKHAILNAYLGAWIAILGSKHRHGRIYYVDGFAGPCKYVDAVTKRLEKTGSPLIAMRVANELRRRHRIGEVVCIFVERNHDRFLSLRKAITSAVADYPFVVVRDPIEGEFADVAPVILKEIELQGAASFFFIDPFGWTGFPLSLIARIMDMEAAEVFITFMYGELIRFIEEPQNIASINALFGTPEARQLATQLRDSVIREHSLRNLYLRQLLKVAHVTYPWPFRVSMEERRRTLYYLIHCTNHIRGLMKMKEAMLRHSAAQMFEYAGPDERAWKYQLPLFPSEQENVNRLKALMLERAPSPGTLVTVEQIWERTWEFPADEKIYKTALRELWEADAIEVHTHDGRGFRGGFQPYDCVIFLSR